MRRVPFVMIAGLSVLGLAAGGVSAGEVYQWKDANGVTHYSQTPPPKGQYQQRQITHQGAAAPQPMTAAASKPTAEENPQCATARASVEALKGSNPVHEADADGKPGRLLGDDERGSRLELANAAVKAYCNQPAG